MGKDRCISSDVLMNDNFMSLPNSAKILYVYFNQETDNLGFVDNLTSIMAYSKAKPKDLQLLVEREYIYKVKDWLYLEVHFRLNNKNLRPERGKKSRFQKIFDEEFTEDERGMYCRKIADKMTENCRQIDDKMPTNCGFLADNIKENQVKEKKLTENKDSIRISTAEELRQHIRGQI